MNDNYTFLDETTKQWRVVVNGREIPKLYESEIEAKTAMEQIDVLDSILAVDNVNGQLLNE